MDRLCIPNLPKNRVKSLIIGEKYGLIASKIEKLGINVILLPEIVEVDPRLSGHADLGVLLYDDHAYLADSVYDKLNGKLSDFGLPVKKITISCKYPYDCRLNACIIGTHIVHSKKVSVLSGKTGFIDVNQGYSKCSICPVTENALITSDPGIEKACVKAGIDVLRIRSGYIDLPGFDTGFIGGASFKISENEMVFTGNITKHPDGIRIKEFLLKYNVDPISLCTDELLDIGSAVLLTEY